MLESILSVTQVPGDGVTVALEFLVTGKLSQIRKEKLAFACQAFLVWGKLV